MKYARDFVFCFVALFEDIEEKSYSLNVNIYISYI